MRQPSCWSIGIGGDLRRHLPRRSPRSGSSPTRRAASPSRWPSSRPSRPRPQALQDELEPAFQDRVLGPLLDRFVGARASGSPRRTTTSGSGSKLDVAGNPPGWTVDRVIVAQGRRHRRRPRRSALLLALLLGMGLGVTARRLHRSAASPATTARTCTSTRRATTAPRRCSARCPTPSTCSRSRSRPASASTPRCPRWRATPTVRSPTSSPGCCRRCRSAWAASSALRALGERSTRARPARLRLRDGAGRRVRHPDRPGAAGAVQEIRIKRRQRAEEAAQKVAGQDHDPAGASSSCRRCSSRCIGPPSSAMIGVFGGGGALN